MSGKKHIEMFRVRVHDLPGSVFSSVVDESARPSAVFQCVLEKPRLPAIQGRPVWRVGKTAPIEGAKSSLFEFGKVTTAKRRDYDEQEGKFREYDDEDAPCTWMFIDMEAQILGIEPKNALAPKASGIAAAFERTLNHNIGKSGLSATIRLISDGGKFVDRLNDAYALLDFTVAMGQLNDGLDDDELVYKPLGKLQKAMRGKRIKADVGGESLDKKTAVLISESAMSMGNQVKAVIREKQGGRRVHISPEDHPARVDLGVDEGDMGTRAENCRKRVARWWASRKGEKS